MEDQAQQQPFLAAASLVRKRIAQVRFARWLQVGHWAVGILAVIAVVLLRRGLLWREGEVWVVTGLLGVWLLAGAIFSLMNRPGALDSLILLDRLGGWKDRFSSAWAFLSQSQRRDAETLHIEKAGGQVAGAVKEFPCRLPLPSLRYVWILPVLALAFALSPLVRIPTAAGDLVLTPEMQGAAMVQAEELARESKNMENLSSLSEEEKKELELLRVEVSEVAERLAESDGLTAGEMLEALEERARASERLAEKLGMGDEAWASREMLEEMASHPDTVNLSLAIKDKEPDPAALEAMELRGILDNPEITRETAERLTGVLENIMNAALEEDRERPVGERFGNASRKMLDGQPKTAAREFEELAKHFRTLQDREEAREKLEQLANSLRDAGSEVSGSELEQMEKIAEENRDERETPAGLQSLDSGDLPEDLQKLLSPQMAQSGAQGGEQAVPGSQPGEGEPQEKQVAPVPGMAQGQNANQGNQQNDPSNVLKAPVPGEEPKAGDEGQGMGLSDKAQDGQGDGGMLSAPVPGMEPGEGARGAGMSMAGGANGQAGRGGNEAGAGTAEMFENETEALKASRDSEVFAQVNENGESTVRAVEGQARSEAATRNRQEVITDFIAAEEQALDGKSLPMSRREHVIRYFSAIRRQFEESGESD